MRRPMLCRSGVLFGKGGQILGRTGADLGRSALLESVVGVSGAGALSMLTAACSRTVAQLLLEVGGFTGR